VLALLLHALLFLLAAVLALLPFVLHPRSLRVHLRERGKRHDGDQRNGGCATTHGPSGRSSTAAYG